THRHPRMPAIRLLNGIRGQKADRVDAPPGELDIAARLGRWNDGHESVDLLQDVSTGGQRGRFVDGYAQLSAAASIISRRHSGVRDSDATKRPLINTVGVLRTPAST